MTKLEQLIESAKLYIKSGEFDVAAQRLRQAAGILNDMHVERETRRDYPEEFTPAPGKVMHAPPGTVPHPTAHLTDKQREALALSEQKSAERIKREMLDKIDRLGRKGENVR